MTNSSPTVSPSPPESGDSFSPLQKVQNELGEFLDIDSPLEVPNYPQVLEEKRKNIKLLSSMILAGSIWFTLVFAMGSHFFVVAYLSVKLADKPISPQSTTEQLTPIKDAIASTNDMAKTLYAILTPLVATVTNYFFEAIREAKDE